MLQNAAIRWAALMTAAAVVIGLLPATIQAAPDTMPAFSATYSVRYGILRGTMTLELEAQDGGFVYRTALRPRGFVSWFRRGEIRETTSLAPGDGLLRPLDYESIDTIAKPTRLVRYEFDHTGGHVTGEYKQRDVDVPMQADGQNRISAQVAIMRALQSGTELTELPVFDRGRWRTFRFETIADQLAKTPAGEFETVEVRYSSQGKNKSWSLHCAIALFYLPVMIVYREEGKIKSRAVLTEYRIHEQEGFVPGQLESSETGAAGRPSAEPGIS